MRGPTVIESRPLLWRHRQAPDTGLAVWGACGRSVELRPNATELLDSRSPRKSDLVAAGAAFCNAEPIKFLSPAAVSAIIL